MPEHITSHIVLDFLKHLVEAPTATAEDISDVLWVRRSTAEILFQVCELRGLIVPRSNKSGYQLSRTLAEFCSSRLTRMICSQCHGRGVAVGQREMFREYEEILSNRGSPDRSVDQYLATPETMVARVSYLIGDHATRRKRVLVLGDDDLTSIGLALYGGPESVTVLEIDPDVISVIRRVAEAKRLPILVEKHDLQEVLPAKYQAGFDSFFGDPPYEYGGLITWVQRGLESLKLQGRGYLACPFHDYTSKSRNYLFQIQSFLISQGFVVSDMIHGFHSYEGNDHQRASMLRFERIKEDEIPQQPRSYFWDPNEVKINQPSIDADVGPFLNELQEQYARTRQ